MHVDTIKEQIRRFIVEHFPVARNRNLDDNDPLLANGILDSLGVANVIVYIEQEFKITVSDEDLLPENFETIKCLTHFIKKKMDMSLQAAL